MKRIISVILLLAVIISFPACTADETIGDISTEEYLSGGVECFVEYTPIESIKDVSSLSNTIVKASYMGKEPLYKNSTSDISSGIFKFKVNKDFTGNCSEDIINIYGTYGWDFITGKVYYLFLNGDRCSPYPHIRYSLSSSFVPGEPENGGKGCTFINDYSLDAGDIKNMDSHIKKELVGKGLYIADDPMLLSESAEDICTNADAIILSEVHSVSYESEVICSALLIPIQTLKALDIDAEISEGHMAVPKDTTVGEQFICVYRYNSEYGHYTLYSLADGIIPADSDRGKSILKHFSAE